MFREGIPGWIGAAFSTVSTSQLPEAEIPTITTADLKAMLDGKEDFVLLDLRATFMQKFTIDDPRCKEVSLNVLHQRWKDIPSGKKIVLMDHIGKRTQVAGRFLAGKGYKNLVKVSGGYSQYIKDGYPVKK